MTRFVRTDRAAGGGKLLSRSEVGPDEGRALFLGRLWALFGRATSIDDGFEYKLEDRESGIAFTAYAGASGPSYGGDVTRRRLLPVARALEALLAETEPADCSLVTSLDVEYGGGKVTIGVRGGEPFEKAVRPRGRGPRGVKTYEECVALAKERGEGYGLLAGWQLCLDQVLPPVPDELEHRGKVYENCVGFAFADKTKVPVLLFDEGDGLEELPLATLGWPKKPAAVVTLWLDSYERWRAAQRKR